MRSGKKPVNCIPCAKRKVRCDKLQPCSHCKRRKQDVCEYPVLGRSDDNPKRVEKLERYIRSLGGDPQDAEQVEESRERGSNESRAHGNAVDGTNTRLTTSENRLEDDTSDPKTPERSIAEQTALVGQDEHVTYIEAPMWYSWSGVKQPEKNAQDAFARHSQQPNPATRVSHCFPTLLDPWNVPGREPLLAQHPSASTANIIWIQYLRNVHPLVKIFFDWEVEPLMRKGAKEPNTLTQGEQSVVFAIYFVAILSISEEECATVLYDRKPQLLERFQRAAEDALISSQFITTTDIRVLQAFMLYLIAMRNRARPAAIYSLMGIAVRLAERMGLHRDGDMLGLSVVRSEERRRMWWQIQSMEISIGQLLGNVSMTLYADWDTQLPSNLEDSDLSPEAQILRPGRRGLTSISHCLWRYEILYFQRAMRVSDGSRKNMPLSYMMSPSVSLAEKDAKLDEVEKALGEKFIQHCEPLNPLHVLIQIGVRSFVLAARRGARQPALVNAKISEMPQRERDDLLKICTTCLDYYVLSVTTESLRGFRWHSENYFQWAAFAYVILEAHHRFEDDSVSDDLWELIRKVYAVHPDLTTAVDRLDIASIAHIALVAWQRRDGYVRERRQQRNQYESPNDYGAPEWILELCRKFDVPQGNLAFASDPIAQEPVIDASQFLPPDFDFDYIDWSFWDQPHLDAALHAPNG